MSETLTTAEKAYTAGLNQSAQDQDAQAERRYQIEQSPLYKALVDLIALAEETKAQFIRNGQTSYAHMTCEEIDLDKLAEAISDQLGGSEAPYAVDAIISDLSE